MTAGVLTSVYLAVCALCAAVLAGRWRGHENGLRPAYVALSWPLVALLLVVYYAAAVIYTLAVVVRGRWPVPGDRGDG